MNDTLLPLILSTLFLIFIAVAAIAGVDEERDAAPVKNSTTHKEVLARAAVAQNPDDGVAHSNLVRALSNNGNFGGAISARQQLVIVLAAEDKFAE